MDILRINFGKQGYYDSIELRTPPNALGRASKNWIPYGEGGLLRSWKGLSGAGIGSRTMFPFRGGWVGLDDIVSPPTTGSGIAFASFFGMCVFAGSGQLVMNGTSIAGSVASSIVRMLLRWNGSYTAPESGPYTAGISEPSPPDVNQSINASSVVPNITADLSFKIAWYRTTTGGRSRASANSATLTLTGKAPVLTIPLAPVGATNLAIFAPELGQAQAGLHYRMTRPNPNGTADGGNLEFKVQDIQRSVGVTLTATDMAAAAGTFTTADVGKRVAVTAGPGTLTNPTTIEAFVSSSHVTLSQAASVNGAATVDIIAYENGIDRAVLINYAESDLSDEVAWVEDFVPGPVSHVAELDKVWVYFMGGDAAAGVSNANGTIMQFSNKNYPESVNPFWKLYLPDAVVDVLMRGLDSYMFVAMRTMIMAFQYVESGGDNAPAAGVVLLQNAGITSPTNWCIRSRFLYVYTGDGDLIRIGEGGAVDRQFSNAVKNLLKTFTTRADVVLSSDGKAQLKVSYHGTSLTFNEDTDSWSTRLALNDYALGNMISAVTTQDGVVCTMEGANAYARTKYDFDRGASYTYGVAATDYIAVDEQFPAILNAVFADIKTDTPNSTAIFGIHRNFEPITLSGTVSRVSTDTFFDVGSGNPFTADHVGYWIAFQGSTPDTAYGATKGYSIARVAAIVNANKVKLCDPTSADLALPADVGTYPVNGIYDTIFAKQIFTKKPTKAGIQQIVNQIYDLPGCYALAVSVAMLTQNTGVAQPLNAALIGDMDPNYQSTVNP